MKVYEDVLAATLSDYSDPRFDEVLALLKRVPAEVASERSTVAGIVAEIEAGRKAAAASDLDTEKTLKVLTGGDGKASGSYAGPSFVPARRAEPPSLPVLGSDPQDSETRDSFSDAADAARARRLREEARQKAIAEAERKSEETQKKMDERLKQKLDEAEWKCNWINGKCEKEATVSSDEVE